MFIYHDINHLYIAITLVPIIVGDYMHIFLCSLVFHSDPFENMFWYLHMYMYDFRVGTPWAYIVSKVKNVVLGVKDYINIV